MKKLFRQRFLVRSGAAVLVPALFLAVSCGGGGEGRESSTHDDKLEEKDFPFTEVAAEVGLDFQHFNGTVGEYYTGEIMGAGVALFDYDNDGDLDAYMIQAGMVDPGRPLSDSRIEYKGTGVPMDRLYRNDLQVHPDGSRTLYFTDVTETSGIRAIHYGMGIAVGDYDNDGWRDLYVMNMGPNQLYRNNGDGSFTDVTVASGTGDPWWSVSGTFVDFDQDGYLDIYSGDYLNWNLAIDKDCFGPSGEEDYCAPKSYLPIPDRLYRNNRDGTFRDVTAETGIAAAKGGALGVVTADFNNDGWIDLYVANDGVENHLWINQGNGTFRNTALLAGCALNSAGKAEASMGVDAADYDGDGDEDLFMAHLTGETNTLYINDGTGIFQDLTVKNGLGPVSQNFTSFGTSWIDFDNDGRLDILVVNGAVVVIEAQKRAGDPFPMRQHNQLFRQKPDGSYEDLTAASGPAFRISEVSRGAAFGDVDNDGDIDVLIGNNNGPARLFLNQVGNHKHWIGLELRDRTGRLDQTAAQVLLTTRSGRTYGRRSRADGSYASSGDPRILIGLGDEGGTVDLTISWPRHGRERFTGLTVDRWMEVRQASGERVEAP